MPARDWFHQPFRHALEKDGWKITHDPLHLQFGPKDLGAEEVIGAEKGGRKIAVEIASFIGPSEMDDLMLALGAFSLYRPVLKKEAPDRVLFLAVRDVTFSGVFDEPIGRLLIEAQNVRLIVFNVQSEVILSWLNVPAGFSDLAQIPSLSEAELRRRESLPHGRALAEILGDLEAQP